MRLWPLLLLLVGCTSAPPESAPAQDEPALFEGADTMSESDLRALVANDVKRFEADPRASALSDAAYRIEYHYRLEGFDRVRVVPRVEKRRVVFRIVEGPRIRLGQVHFDGATVFKVDELKQLVPGRFLGEPPPYSVRLALLIEDGIVGAYRDRGYADIVVVRRSSADPDKNGRISLWFAIDEGKPYTLSELRGLPFDAGLHDKTAEFLGRPFTPGTGDAVEAVIVDYYREHGRPFATARARPQIDRETGTVALDLDVRPGVAVLTGGMELTGTLWTRSSFVENRTDIMPGKVYKQSDLRRAEERLMATGVFKRARVSPGKFQEETETVPLDVEVQERESGEASLRGGYGSFERFRLGADLTGVNIWGGAESIRVGGNVSWVGYRGEAELGVPYLFGTELRLGLSGYYENREYPSFDALARGGVLSFSYPILTPLSATVGVRHANIRTSNVDPSVPPGDLLDFSYTAFFLSPTLDLRDNALMPTRGILFAAEVSWAPSTLLSDVEFWSASGRFSFYFPFPGGLVFASSFQGGVIAPIGGTNEIPIALREFAGGTNTVRGYKFEAIGPKVNGEPTGGEAFLAIQSEIRFPIIGDLQGALFSDQGGVWFDRVKVNLSEVRYSVGVGLRFVTPAGALVVDVGWNPHTKDGEHPVEFHLSVGFPF